MKAPDWIAVDWGTSHMRVWLMGPDGAAERRDSDKGMGSLTRDGFEPALLEVLNGVVTRPTPVIICGMAGSRQGWTEAPYETVPCTPPLTGVRVKTHDPNLIVTILPGLKQTNPADVMRGEETQIGGFLAAEPGFDGTLCLPGTHTKWAQISAGEVVSFRTFMTGELYALLGTHSVLRHSLATGWDAPAFLDAVSDAMAKPALLTARLFGLRADDLLNATDPAKNRARLSGLLIGMEIAAARPYWLGLPTVILGEDGIASAYAAALLAQGADARSLPAADITLAGLTAAYHAMKGQT